MHKFLMVIILLCWGSTTSAQEYSIHVDWGYTPPFEPAVTGYQLYKTGVKLTQCLWLGATTTSGDCPVDLSEGTTNPFTLTAVFTDGTESPHSSPFNFTTPKPAPSTKPTIVPPKILSVNVTD